jgi:hypothetical protein
MDALFEALIKAILPHLRDAKTVGAAVFTVGTLTLLLAARHLSKKTTSDFQAAAKQIESERPATPTLEHEHALLKLAHQTMLVRVERAEWAAQEWQQQHAKTQRELNETAAELAVTRKSLARFEVASEQDAERALASETTERIQLAKKRPRQGGS